MRAASKFVHLRKEALREEVYNARDSLLSTESKSSTSGPQKKKRVREATTNVMAAQLSTLAQDAEMATGDPVFCNQCKAVFSCISKLSKKKWPCEFCGHENDIELEEEEAELFKGKESVDYVLEAPAAKITTEDADDGTVIFCIDTSGSMCVTTPVQGNVQLKGNKGLDSVRAGLAGDRDVARSQYSRNESRNVTYISRLQAVQAAVDSQLKQMEKDHPHRKVGLVTFNREVSIVGDGSLPEVIIAGDKLNDYDQLMEAGRKAVLTNPISTSRSALETKMYALEEGGPTALGPALLVSIGLAVGIGKRGARIVLCTDGKSNVGVGALEDIKTDQQRAEIAQWYERIGNTAVAEGISISVISISDEDCRLEELGSLADATSGNVEQVNPVELTKNFSNILSVPVIATGVNIKLLLHKGLFVKSDDDDDEESEKKEVKNNSWIEKDIGNATADTEVTFEFGVRPETIDELQKKLEEAQKEKPGEKVEPTQLPFQMQIRYTKPNGMKCIRTLSRMQEVTMDQEKAEAAADLDVLGKNAMKNAARMAQRGDYSGARLQNRENMRLWSRAAQNDEQKAQLSVWGGEAEKMETELATETRKELDDGMDMDEEMEEDGKTDKKAKKAKVLMARKGRRNDRAAKNLYSYTSKMK